MKCAERQPIENGAERQPKKKTWRRKAANKRMAPKGSHEKHGAVSLIPTPGGRCAMHSGGKFM